MFSAEEIAFEQECLEFHNRFRAQHGCPPLKINTSLTKYAKDWAQYLAEKGEFNHNPEKMYGENLFMGQGFQTVSGELPVTKWYEEIKDYNFSLGKFSPLTGHFTQVIWKNTEEVGIAIAKNGDVVVVVANYKPAGNVQGQFIENVPPKQKKASLSNAEQTIPLRNDNNDTYQDVQSVRSSSSLENRTTCQDELCQATPLKARAQPVDQDLSGSRKGLRRTFPDLPFKTTTTPTRTTSPDLLYSNMQTPNRTDTNNNENMFQHQVANRNTCQDELCQATPLTARAQPVDQDFSGNRKGLRRTFPDLPFKSTPTPTRTTSPDLPYSNMQTPNTTNTNNNENMFQHQVASRNTCQDELCQATPLTARAQPVDQDFSGSRKGLRRTFPDLPFKSTPTPTRTTSPDLPYSNMQTPNTTNTNNNENMFQHQVASRNTCQDELCQATPLTARAQPVDQDFSGSRKGLRRTFPDLPFKSTPTPTRTTSPDLPYSNMQTPNTTNTNNNENMFQHQVASRNTCQDELCQATPLTARAQPLDQDFSGSRKDQYGRPFPDLPFKSSPTPTRNTCPDLPYSNMQTPNTTNTNNNENMFQHQVASRNTCQDELCQATPLTARAQPLDQDFSGSRKDQYGRPFPDLPFKSTPTPTRTTSPDLPYSNMQTPNTTNTNNNENMFQHQVASRNTCQDELCQATPLTAKAQPLDQDFSGSRKDQYGRPFPDLPFKSSPTPTRNTSPDLPYSNMQTPNTTDTNNNENIFQHQEDPFSRNAPANMSVYKDRSYPHSVMQSQNPTLPQNAMQAQAPTTPQNAMASGVQYPDTPCCSNMSRRRMLRYPDTPCSSTPIANMLQSQETTGPKTGTANSPHCSCSCNRASIRLLCRGPQAHAILRRIFSIIKLRQSNIKVRQCRRVRR